MKTKNRNLREIINYLERKMAEEQEEKEAEISDVNENYDEIYARYDAECVVLTALKNNIEIKNCYEGMDCEIYGCSNYIEYISACGHGFCIHCIVEIVLKGQVTTCLVNGQNESSVTCSLCKQIFIKLEPADIFNCNSLLLKINYLKFLKTI